MATKKNVATSDTLVPCDGNESVDDTTCSAMYVVLI